MSKPAGRVLAAAAMATAMLAGQAHAASASNFTVFSYDAGDNGTIDLPGQLFIPTTYDASKTYPLVLFLDGTGGAGTNNTSQLANIDGLLAAAKARDFFVYAPQSSSGWWNEDNLNPAMDMVAKATQAYSIDTGRLYVTGLSSGGAGTRLAIDSYTDSFAAAVPVCAGPKDETLSRLVAKPIWLFHARDDGTVSVNYSRTLVNGIRAADGAKPAVTFPLDNAPSNPYYNTGSPFYTDGSTFYSENNLRYTEYPSGDHGIWGRAYKEQPMYDWLLAQRNAPRKPQQGQSILVDFGSVGALTVPDSQNRSWNSTVMNEETTLGPVVAFPRTDDGRGTGVVVSVTDKFSGRANAGLTVGSIYPAEAAQDCWMVGSANPGALQLDGLEPGGAYRVTAFGSYNNDDGGRGRNTRFTIGTEFHDLDIANNLSEVALFQNVVADSLGRLQLTVATTPGTNSRYGGISVLEVTAVPEPSALSALLGLPMLLRRRRKP